MCVRMSVYWVTVSVISRVWFDPDWLGFDMMSGVVNCCNGGEEVFDGLSDRRVAM